MRELLARLKEKNIHVSLEKEQLEIKFEDGQLSDQLFEELKANKEALVSYLKNRISDRSEYKPIPVIAYSPAGYELSSSQRRLWVLNQVNSNNISYNISEANVFNGTLDRAVLARALNTLIERHEILRTVFLENAGSEVRQYIKPMEESGFGIMYYDLRNDDEREKKMQEMIQAEYAKPFDLSQCPLLRVSLYQTAELRWVFVYTMHHIITDGWSMNLLMKELLLLYNAYEKGGNDPLTPLRLQYKDYAAWQQNLLKDNSLANERKYWLEQMKGELPVLKLPVDKTRPAVKTYNGGMVSGRIGREVTSEFRQFCYRQDATLFMGLMATVNVLLHRYTSEEDIIIGSPIAGRQHADLEDQIGFYVNTLALRTRFSGADNFRDLLINVKEVIVGAFEHQAYPFDELVNDLSLQHDSSRNPLFEVMVVLQNYSVKKGNGSEPIKNTVSADNSYQVYHTSKFDLTFNFFEAGEELLIDIDYNSDIFEKQSVERLLHHFENLLAAVLASPLMPVHSLDYLSASEKHRLLSVFNNTVAAYPQHKTIVSLFEEQVAATPDNIALVYEGSKLTYSQLNAFANQLAGYLRANYNLQPDDLVGVQLPRNEWLIISILGILKSGAAYVPIDPFYPRERKAYMRADSNCKLLVNELELEQFKEVIHLYSHNNISPVNSPASLAYVIYTSGSTGQPKGVMIEHGSLNARIHYLKHTYDLNETDAVLFYRSYSFDGAIEEYLLPVLTGACCVIASEDYQFDFAHVIDYAARHNITKVNMPPALLADFVQFVDERSMLKLSSLKHVVSGGDILSRKVISGYFEKFSARLYNTYGPTENTIDSTNFLITGLPANDSVPIGKPVQNTQAYILDKNLQLVPVGVYGELYFSGDGLSRGYLHKPDLTAERFLANPFGETGRMYRTGDLGRWLPDGNIEFAGRVDEQVKIRGYRIELGEVENALQLHPEIESAAVIARRNERNEEDKELLAYFTGKTTISAEDVRNFLRLVLPAFMMPAYIIQLQQLPLNANGKVDKKALPAPSGHESGTAWVAPRNETEEKLVKIWMQILGQKRIGVTDNFFDIGGNSIKAMKLKAVLNKEHGFNLKIHDIFNQLTIEKMALNHLKGRKIIVLTESPVKPKQNIYFIPPIFGNSIVYKPLSNLLKEQVNCYGFQYSGLEKDEKLFGSVEEMAQEFSKEIINNQATEDVFIVMGYSMGAIVAFEMAKILDARYRNMKIILVDKPVHISDGEKNDINGEVEELISYNKNFIDSGNIEEMIIKRFLANSIRMLNSYRQTGKIKSRIYFFETKEHRNSIAKSWSAYTEQEIEVAYITGDHWNALSPENLDSYANVIRNAFTQANS